MSKFITLTQVQRFAGHSEQSPLVVNVDRIDVFHDERIQVGGMLYQVKEITAEIWKKIDTAEENT